MTAKGITDALVDVRRRLVDRGYCADAVERAMQRVAIRATEAGLGKVHQTRRLERDLYPGLAPRPVAAGDRCFTVPSYPGQENAYQAQVAQFAAQGLTVTSVEPYKGHQVTYVCPPGQTPRENQVLSREVF